jgi:molecular chaperone DnaK (HSP70)
MSRIVGDAAKNSASKFPDKSIYDVKRFIGKKCSDPKV